MTLHVDLVAYLTAHSGIELAVPGGVFHETYPQQQETFPVMTLQKAGDLETDIDMEYPDEPTGDILNEARYQFDIWGITTEQVKDAEDAVHSVLRTLRGVIGTTRIHRLERTNSQDLGERFGDKRRRRVSMDYVITFS
jgi:uncharacterized lipoprotein